MDKDNVPKMEGWLTLPEVGQKLNVSKQQIHKLAFEQDAFPGIRALGDKPVYLVPQRDFDALVDKREKQAIARERRVRALDTALSSETQELVSVEELA